MSNYQDFANEFLKTYGIEDGREELSSEDKYFLRLAFKLLTNQNTDKEKSLEEIKARFYNDYFNMLQDKTLSNKTDIDFELEKLFENFCETDVEEKNGASYSDYKQNLKSDSAMFDENLIKTTAQMSGIGESKIKSLLQPKLEVFLNDKLNYYIRALQHIHSIYSFALSEK